jgi:hypothetical protein
MLTFTNLLATTFYAGAYTVVELQPDNYSFFGHTILDSSARFTKTGDPLEVDVARNAECTIAGTASAAFKNLYDEKTGKMAPGGADVDARAVNIYPSGDLPPPLLVPWRWGEKKTKSHADRDEDARNVMLSGDRKTLYWKQGYASLWGETLERKEGMSPYDWLDVVSETDDELIAARVYPGGLFTPSVSSLIMNKKTGRPIYSFNHGDITGILVAGVETWTCD